mmetsp:Transcript_13386/g.29073  ORF Transcript_13386/g.29073 Transcript_13386/m.29073 type:complete len:118 (-) Transcript_13386:66-419(-)
MVTLAAAWRAQRDSKSARCRPAHGLAEMEMCPPQRQNCPSTMPKMLEETIKMRPPMRSTQNMTRWWGSGAARCPWRRLSGLGRQWGTIAVAVSAVGGEQGAGLRRKVRSFMVTSWST